MAIRSNGRVWIVAGAPGAGKSYFADRFVRARALRPALLDKDTMFNALIDSFMVESGRDVGGRETEWFDRVIKPYSYSALMDVARQIQWGGCDVVVTAPFTEALYEPGEWDRVCSQLGGPAAARLIWIRSDASTLRRRLVARGLERDSDKLASYEAYVERVHLDSIPVAPHTAIDNRSAAELSMEQQVLRLL